MTSANIADALQAGAVGAAGISMFDTASDVS
jgi:hypothetical protein